MVNFKLSGALLFCILGISCAEASDEKKCDEQGYTAVHFVYINPSALSKKELFTVDRTALSHRDAMRLKHVLDYYGIDYKIKAGILKVKCATWKDKELMANFTKKSNSDEWLENHGYEMHQ